MADLVEIAFPSEEKAEHVRQKLLDMQKEYLIELSDAVIAVKQPNGHVKLNQLFNPTASGAVSGTFWGALIGMIFLMPLAGAARFNFTFDFSGGVQIVNSTRRAFTIGYKYQHISNGYRATFNPGVDVQMIFAGFSIFK